MVEINSAIQSLSLEKSLIKASDPLPSVDKRDARRFGAFDAGIAFREF